MNEYFKPNADSNPITGTGLDPIFLIVPLVAMGLMLLSCACYRILPYCTNRYSPPKITHSEPVEVAYSAGENSIIIRNEISNFDTDNKSFNRNSWTQKDLLKKLSQQHVQHKPSLIVELPENNRKRSVIDLSKSSKRLSETTIYIDPTSESNLPEMKRISSAVVISGILPTYENPYNATGQPN